MNLLFDFTVDRDNATIKITREFDAGLDLVWDAWTQAELLDQWIAPKPWRAETKEMDFREGGRWLYAMLSPENVAHWSLAQFISINEKSSFTSRNSFCDENGGALNNNFTSSITTTSFAFDGAITKVTVVKKMSGLEELEKFVSMGFKEGMSVTLGYLDELLAALSSR